MSEKIGVKTGTVTGIGGVVKGHTVAKVRGRFQLTQEEFNSIQRQYPELDLLKVGVDGIGVVVLKAADRGDYKRFSKKTLGKNAAKYDRDDVYEELARCGVAWPPVDELEHEIDAKRKWGAWSSLGAHVARLGGIDSEEIEGN